jgi:DNA-binding transcriptional LysR family regulator
MDFIPRCPTFIQARIAIWKLNDTLKCSEKMNTPMLDLDLLRSFVSVVDAGGFTRASERVHRTQSTVSQQIRRLEESVGRPLLHREGKSVSLTEEGERLLSYARRLLVLAEEARTTISQPTGHGVVRLGVPEDFAAYRLTELLSDFARSRPGLRLDVRCDLSVKLASDIARQDLDLALLKRLPGESSAVATWPETLKWVTGARYPFQVNEHPVPLAVFPQGCLYRNQAVHALEAAGRSWRVAYNSPNLSGIQAAVSAGLGISILPDVAILADHRVLGELDGFPPIKNTELALIVALGVNPVVRCLADSLMKFCDTHNPGRGGKVPHSAAA